MTENGQLFELADFLHTRLKPAYSAFQPKDLASRAELQEALWWLQLGADVGYFPAESVDLLVGHYSQPLKEDFDDYLKFQSYHFSPRLNDWLKTLLTSTDRASLDTFTETTGLRAQFQTALLVSSSLVDDEVTQSFLRGITFATEEAWSLLKPPQTASEESRALLVGNGRLTVGRRPDSSVMQAGFFRTLEHMDLSKQFCDDLRSDPTATDKGRAILLRRLGGIQSWRLNFWNPAVETRFIENIADSSSAIKTELMAASGDLAFVDRFRAVATDLMKTWKDNHRPEQLLAVAFAT